MNKLRLACMALIVFAPGAAVAQPAAPPSITTACEVAHDRFQYLYENPSTFGAGLVPHDFTQTYWPESPIYLRGTR